MKSTLTNDMHLRIELKTDKGKSKKFFIHRLVYQAFVGELEEGKVIEHLNSIGYRNYYKNLRQSPQKENIRTCINQDRRVGNKKKYCCYEQIHRKNRNWDTIKVLYNHLGIPVNNGSLQKLIKTSKFKQSYEFIKAVKVKRLSKAK